MAEPQTLLGSWAGPAVAPELAVRSGPRSVCPGSAPDAFGTRFPARRAGSSLAQPLQRSRTRSKCAPSRRPANPRERRDAPCGDSLARSPGRSQRAPAGHPARRCRGSRPWVGEGGPAAPCSPFLPQLALGLLCFPFAAGRVRRLALSPRRPACRDSRLSSGSLSLSLFPNPLLFSPPSGSPGKVASPSLPKSLSSLRGGGGDWGRVGARSIPGSSSGGAPAFPPRRTAERCSRRPPDPGRRAVGGGSAAREHSDFPQDPGRLLWGRNSGGPASILSKAPPRSPKPPGLKASARTVARRG